MSDHITSVNRLLDRSARLHVRLPGRSLHAFHFCGGVGLVSALSVSMALCIHKDLSPAIIGLIALSAVLTVLFMAMAVKIITGEEKLVCYHSMITVLITASILLHLLKQPVWLYLDIIAIGLGVFLAAGRIGCLMVGCCHGRPAKWGVRYTDAHAAAGFNRRLVGQRLVPVQAIESLFLLLVSSAATTIFLNGFHPGSAFVLCVVAYGSGRFGIEFLRGDTDRPIWWGYSEAQWISMVVVLGCFFLPLIDFHLQWYHVITALCFICALLSTVVKHKT